MRLRNLGIGCGSHPVVIPGRDEVASPESILTMVVMDSGLAALRRPGMTTPVGDTQMQSRGAICVRALRYPRPSRKEGAGNAGCSIAPAASCASRKHTSVVTTGTPNHSG